MQLHEEDRILAEAPAFLFSVSKDEDWPELQTTYVPGDLLHEYMHSTGGMDGIGRSGSRSTDDAFSGSPIRNPLLRKLFLGYIRGRYVHDGRLENARFHPIAETLAKSMLLGYYMSEMMNAAEKARQMENTAPPVVEKSPPARGNPEGFRRESQGGVRRGTKEEERAESQKGGRREGRRSSVWRRRQRWTD